MFMFVTWGFILQQSAIADAPRPPVETLDSHRDVFVNPDCATSDSCRLKEFSVQVDRYRVNLPKGMVNFGTRMNARFQTDAVSGLEEFGLAQFLRGCQFTSKRKADGTIERRKDIFIPWHDDTNIPYVFTQWTIDGPSPDPLDWGFDGQENRHFFYKWSPTPGSVDPATARYYGQGKPTQPALFVRDLPGTAFYDAKTGEARNISVEFRTCVYKAAEVPRQVGPTELDFAKPLQCFTWASSWIYDFDTGGMKSPVGVVPFCQ